MVIDENLANASEFYGSSPFKNEFQTPLVTLELHKGQKKVWLILTND